MSELKISFSAVPALSHRSLVVVMDRFARVQIPLANRALKRGLQAFPELNSRFGLVRKSLRGVYDLKFAHAARKAQKLKNYAVVYFFSG